MGWLIDWSASLRMILNISSGNVINDVAFFTAERDSTSFNLLLMVFQELCPIFHNYSKIIARQKWKSVSKPRRVIHGIWKIYMTLKFQLNILKYECSKKDKKSRTKSNRGGTFFKTRNTCTQQPLAYPSNICPKNPSNINNFSKLSKRQTLLNITGKGHAI